jgi:hypothetical protein
LSQHSVLLVLVAACASYWPALQPVTAQQPTSLVGVGAWHWYWLCEQVLYGEQTELALPLQPPERKVPLVQLLQAPHTVSVVAVAACVA